jgi:hypothetical protein
VSTTGASTSLPGSTELNATATLYVPDPFTGRPRFPGRRWRSRFRLEGDAAGSRVGHSTTPGGDRPTATPPILPPPSTRRLALSPIEVLAMPGIGHAALARNLAPREPRRGAWKHASMDREPDGRPPRTLHERHLPPPLERFTLLSSRTFSAGETVGRALIGRSCPCC